eukprot:56794-Eustigmatos_ZCMA.PRE.2
MAQSEAPTYRPQIIRYYRYHITARTLSPSIDHSARPLCLRLTRSCTLHYHTTIRLMNLIDTTPPPQ